MLLIHCPHCGPRAEHEFTYGGDATVRRPADPAAATDSATGAEWTGYVFLRDNPKGPHREYWLHQFGCRRWFEVRRDTLTHEIAATVPPGGEEA